MAVPQEDQEVWQWPLWQGSPNRAVSPQQGQSAGSQEQKGDRPLGCGQDGGLDWAEAQGHSFAGWFLSAAEHNEQCSPEYAAC